MRKSTVFISAVLTTFALVMLYSIVSAYRGNKDVIKAEVQPTETFVPEATSTPAPTFITPEEAAQLAAQVVGQDNLLSAESANVDGVDAYKITFTNNDVVYVSLDGQIISVQVAPVVVNAAPPVVKKNKKDHNGGGGGGAAGGESGNQEDHDDD